MGNLYIVSTCKESLEVIQRFVQRNLDAGADHLFIFLDAPADSVQAFLTECPHTTPIRTGRDYWRGRRPGNLNRRQEVNANLIRTLLAPLDQADWLVHLDADEYLHLDPGALDAVPATAPAVRLLPMEAISTEQPGWEGWYKRWLSRDELTRLHTLGLLSDPQNRYYFNGHHVGKIGIRPTLTIAVGIHYAFRNTEHVKLQRFPGLFHLHDHATTFERFTSKITRYAEAPASGGLKSSQQSLRSVVRTLLDEPLSEAERTEALRELYHRTTVDPAEELRRLGVLVNVPAERRPAHSPQPHTAHQQQQLDRLLQELLAESPLSFSHNQELGVQAAALARAGERLAPDHPGLAAAIRATVGAAAIESVPEPTPIRVQLPESPEPAAPVPFRRSIPRRVRRMSRHLDHERRRLRR